MAKKNQNTQEVEVKTEEVTIPTPEPKAEKPKKVQTRRVYQYNGGRPQNPKGQVVSVLLALDEVKEGTLEDFVKKVNELDPNYKTKTPIEASVKFHLHLLSLKGYVQEVDTPVEAQ